MEQSGAIALKRFIPFILGVLTVFSLVLPAHAADSEVLLSASEFDYPPFCIENSEGQADGFSVELLRAALQAVGRDVEFDLGPWNAVRQSLVQGEVQVLPLVGRTPEREDLFDFTFPYLNMHGTIVVREDNRSIRNLADLSGKQIAVMNGDNAEEFLRRTGIDARIETHPTFEVALRELSAGQNDAVIIQKLTALHLINRMGVDNLKTVGPPLKEFVQSFCFAVREGDKDLLSLLNEGLAIVFANGTFRQLHAKWFGPIEDRQRRSRIVVGGDIGYPPYEFLDENGQPTGYNVELTRAIARQAGLDVVIELGSWADIREKLAANQVDLIQGMFYSPERDKVFDFSPAHSVVAHTVVTRKDSKMPGSMSDLGGRSILVLKGDIMHDLAIALGYGKQLFPVDTQEQALRLLAEGRHDCALLARIPAHYWIEKNGWSNLQVSDRPLKSPEYCFAVLPRNDWLLDRFSEGLANLKASGEYRQIYSKWLGPYEPHSEGWQVFKVILWLAVPLFVLFAVILIWSRTLKLKVRERTEELEKEIVERKQSEQALKTSESQLKISKIAAEEATRAKSEFLANMSHEIRTPLNGLFGMLQYLQTTSLQKEQSESIDIALQSGQKLLNILNDILDLSRIEAGKLELVSESFNPANTAGDVTSLFLVNARDKGIELNCEFASDFPMQVFGDEGRLRQILFNLVGNAVKFTDQGEVRIEGFARESATCPGKVNLFYMVTDTGIGIPEERLSSIFDPFTQVDGTFARAHGGSGLGLSIVKRLVDLMNGKVEITSQAGEGTLVTFSVEMESSSQMGEQVSFIDTSQNAEACELAPLKILVVEDERVNRLVLERLLKKQKHSVVSVSDGYQYLKALESDHFDLVLMDIQMPRMNGMEATQMTRDLPDPEKSQIPIIALTAHAMRGDREKFLAAGMDDYISKPIQAKDLYQVVQRFS